MLYILSVDKSKQQTERSSLKKYLKAGGGSRGVAPLPQACQEQYTILYKPFPQADSIRYRIA